MGLLTPAIEPTGQRHLYSPEQQRRGEGGGGLGEGTWGPDGPSSSAHPSTIRYATTTSTKHCFIFGCGQRPRCDIRGCVSGQYRRRPAPDMNIFAARGEINCL